MDFDDNDETTIFGKTIWTPITFCRYYAAGYPLLAKIVHDQKIREALKANSVAGVQPQNGEFMRLVLQFHNS
jgi:hypothetical protein